MLCTGRFSLRQALRKFNRIKYEIEGLKYAMKCPAFEGVNEVIKLFKLNLRQKADQGVQSCRIQNLELGRHIGVRTFGPRWI